jgi:hypothetical protein
VEAVVGVPVADVRAGHLLPRRVDLQVAVAVGLVDPEEYVPRHRLTVPLHPPEGVFELLPLPGGDGDLAIKRHPYEAARETVEIFTSLANDLCGAA